MSARRPLHRLALAVALACAACAGGAPPRAVLPGGLAYRVFLPPGYPSDAPYPVVLFLHDYFGDSGILWRQGVMAELGRRMADGRAPRFVLVAPDGRHEWWTDSWDGARRYESWVAEDLLRAIEARFAVRRDRGGRAVAGISMGGLGAVRMALRRPAVFAAAGSLSGALVPIDRAFVADARWPLRSSLERVFGDGDATLGANDLRTLLGRLPQDAAPPRLVLRCGTGDKYHLDAAARAFADRAAAAGVRPELTLEPGTHDWGYWRRVTPDWLSNLARGLAATPAR